MNEFGLYPLPRGVLAYFIIVREDGVYDQIFKPSKKDIEELLKRYLAPAPLLYILKQVDELEPDIYGFVIELEKFQTSWQKGEID